MFPKSRTAGSLATLFPIAAATLAAGLTAAAPGVARAEGESVNGFPNWEERLIHEWVNRARSAPDIDLMGCGDKCPEASCYEPHNPVYYDFKLNRAARFHCDEMALQGYRTHDSACDIVSNIDDIWPDTCDGSTACACEGGIAGCAGVCPNFASRSSRFGAGANGEIMAWSAQPNSVFYAWLHERHDDPTCGNGGSNIHRWLILERGSGFGAGFSRAHYVGDFGGSANQYPIPSGIHHPRSGGSVEAWANWYSDAAPAKAQVNLEGTCQPMTLERGDGTNGAYKADLTPSGNCARYFFVFEDASGTEFTYPDTGSLGIGADEASCPVWDAARPADCNCVPGCDGKTCGDDGCGGTCGTCDSGQSCVSGQCQGGDGSGSSSGGSAGSSGSATATTGASGSGTSGSAGGSQGDAGTAGEAGPGGDGATDGVEGATESAGITAAGTAPVTRGATGGDGGGGCRTTSHEGPAPTWAWLVPLMALGVQRRRGDAS